MSVKKQVLSKFYGTIHWTHLIIKEVWDKISDQVAQNLRICLFIKKIRPTLRKITDFGLYA